MGFKYAGSEDHLGCCCLLSSEGWFASPALLGSSNKACDVYWPLRGRWGEETREFCLFGERRERGHPVAFSNHIESYERMLQRWIGHCWRSRWLWWGGFHDLCFSFGCFERFSQWQVNCSRILLVAVYLFLSLCKPITIICCVFVDLVLLSPG